jgi:nucleoside-diphosphate-sugar epimerase
MPSTCLITGATGFVGGHLAESCAARGWRTRALVRKGADGSRLGACGVELVAGDLTDADSIRKALEGVDVVFHCAARVGDWGPVDGYRAVNVEGLRHLLDACKGSPLSRFVHFSSLGVYASGHHDNADEDIPLPASHVDGYTQSKVEAEALALSYQRESGVPVVVLRPGFIYGPRDKVVLPRLLENLRQGVVRYIGSGEQALNTIHVENLVEAALLAVEAPGAVGRVYNLTDGEKVSKRRFIEAVCDGFGLPRPRHHVPLWLAQLVTWVQEGWARRRGAPEPPRMTQARLKFLGYNLDFNIDRSRKELGYRPKWTFEAGMAQTIAWYRQNNSQGAQAGA